MKDKRILSFDWSLKAYNIPMMPLLWLQNSCCHWSIYLLSVWPITNLFFFEPIFLLDFVMPAPTLTQTN